MTPEERHDIRQIELDVLAEVEQVCACPGSYRYCCCTPDGVIVLAHKAFGRVLRRIA